MVLERRLTKLDDRNIRVELTGQTLSHARTQSVDDLELKLDKALFQIESVPDDVNLSIQFVDNPNITYDTVFKEADTQATIGNKVTLTITNDQIDPAILNIAAAIIPPTLPRGLHRCTCQAQRLPNRNRAQGQYGNDCGSSLYG